jgi:hypothetical protein
MQKIPFLIEALLDSPVIISQEAYLTLDSLLSASCQLSEEDDSSLPLQKNHDVYHASAGILVGKPISTETTFVSAMTNRDYSNERIIPNKSKRLVVSRVAFPDKPRLDSYRVHHVRSVVWFGFGDPDKTLEIISRLTGIGKRCNSGFGQVRSFSLKPLSSDYSLKLPNSTPARPIPVSLCQHIGINVSASILDRVTYKPNYFDFQHADMCVVPTVRRIQQALVKEIIGFPNKEVA